MQRGRADAVASSAAPARSRRCGGSWRCRPWRRGAGGPGGRRRLAWPGAPATGPETSVDYSAARAHQLVEDAEDAQRERDGSDRAEHADDVDDLPPPEVLSGVGREAGG